MAVEIRKLNRTDWAEVRELLALCHLPTDDLDEQAGKVFHAAINRDRVVGVTGIELYGPVGLVRSLAVNEVFRGKGIGEKLYAAIENYALQNDVLRLYLLTETAEQYFRRLGYEVIDRDIAPMSIQQTRQFSQLCPSSAVFMQKSFNSTQAREKFDSGLFCAESALSEVAHYYGIESDLIPAIATGLCSGMARTGGVCGALSGSILAINLIHGRKSANDSVAKNYTAVQELVTDFAQTFGSTNCTKLLECDLGTQSGQTRFNEKKLERRCREYTAMSADLAIKAIENAKNDN